MIEHHGSFDGKGRRIGIVVSRFNDFITKQLLNGAHDCLVRHGVEEGAIVVAWVPGAWEIPSAIARMSRSGGYDALVALGAVVRGATAHFDYVAGNVASGVAAAGANGEIPVVFGVLTTDTVEQAVERAGTKAGNKGWDAGLAALEMANLFDQLGK